MRPIPPSVKSEILRKYLEGYSIPAIRKLFNVSVGLYQQLQKSNQRKMSILYIYMRSN